MKPQTLLAAFGLFATLSACASTSSVPQRAAADFAGAGLSFQQEGLTQPAAFQAVMPASFSVAQINVTVPQSLTVSEANGYYPNADIVWRGDVIGDRRAQIKAIFEEAFDRGTQDFIGETPVIVDVRVKRFHSVTERTRARIGGVHNMEFFLTVFDAQTGAIVMPTREISANLPAFGGADAIAAEQQGQTQKVRVTTYLALTIEEELRKRPI